MNTKINIRDYYSACWDAIVDRDTGKPTGQGFIAYDPDNGSVGGYQQLAPDGEVRLHDIESGHFGDELPENEDEFIDMCLECFGAPVDTEDIEFVD